MVLKDSKTVKSFFLLQSTTPVNDFSQIIEQVHTLYGACWEFFLMNHIGIFLKCFMLYTYINIRSFLLFFIMQMALLHSGTSWDLSSARRILSSGWLVRILRRPSLHWKWPPKPRRFMKTSFRLVETKRLVYSILFFFYSNSNRWWRACAVVFTSEKTYQRCSMWTLYKGKGICLAFQQ